MYITLQYLNQLSFYFSLSIDHNLTKFYPTNILIPVFRVVKTLTCHPQLLSFIFGPRKGHSTSNTNMSIRSDNVVSHSLPIPTIQNRIYLQ